MNELSAPNKVEGHDASCVGRTRTPRQLDRVVVINDISTMKGGATGVALMSLGLLRDAGVPVTFIAGDDAAHADPLALAGECVVLGGKHILAGPRIGAAMRGLYNRRAAGVLGEWIARYDTPGTVYHLHGWSKILSPSIFKALQPVVARLVLHAHDYFLACPNGGYFDFKRGRPCELTALSARCLTCNCDRRNYAQKVWRAGRLATSRALLDLRSVGCVLAVHEAMVPLFKQAGLVDVTIKVLRNPAMPWRRERVTAERNRTFLFVGRLDWDKGGDLLAAAARRARVPLRMIGAGPLSGMLARDYPEIELTGWKFREGIAELCHDARAVVVPTRSRESFGLTALEAMMSGLPVVISKHATLASEVAGNGFGFACDPHDEQALAEFLAGLAHDDTGVERMSRAAHARARMVAPTPKEWCERLLAFYSATLNCGAPANLEGRRHGESYRP